MENKIKKSKRHGRDQKHQNRNEECLYFNRLISRLGLAEERISELEDMSTEITKLKTKEKKIKTGKK